MGLAVFVALLGYLDIGKSLGKIAHLNLKYFLIVVCLMAVQQYLGYVKWRVMYHASIENHRQPLLPVYASVLVGSMITPGRSGDILVSLSWRSIQGKVLAWSIFHRISEGSVTIIISLAIFGFFFNSYFESFRWPYVLVFLFLAVLAIFISLNRKAGMSFLKSCRDILLKFRGLILVARILKYEERIKRQMKFYYDTMAQFKSKHVLVLLIFITLLNRGVIIFLNGMILASLGVFVPWMIILGILASIWIGVFLAPTPGGLGIGDIAPSLILSGVGFKEYAGGFILLNRLIEASIILFWSFVFIRTRTREKSFVIKDA